MYTIDKNQPFSDEIVRKILNEFQTRELPKLIKYNDYYEGKQAIMRKQPSDVGKPCNKVCVNYSYNIVNNYLGYLTGKPITYATEDCPQLQDILNYNDIQNEDSELLRQALIYGIGYEINYLDEYGKQRFKVLDSRQCIPVYDDTISQNLLYVIRFWQDRIWDSVDNQRFTVQVYGPNTIKTYKASQGFLSLQFINEVNHHFGQCPINVFNLNVDNKSIFDQVLTLQDAYNNLISSEVDDFEAFCDAYLILKGITAEEDDLRSMKENRVLMIDSDSDAQYLTKSVSDTQIENMLKNLNDQIHTIANSPDFNDEKFLAQSGIAMRYKLVGFENNASNIEANMKKALQRRIENICAIINLTDEAMWRDIEITFTRNLPVDYNELIAQIQGLNGIVSQRTLLGQIPFIRDVDAELERLAEEKAANMSLYDFGEILNEQDNDDSLLERQSQEAI